MTQTLHLMNSPELLRQLTQSGSRAEQLSQNNLTDDQIVEELYLAIYSRFPVPQEQQIATGYLREQGDERRQGIEDLMWALMNTPEFVFLD